MNVREIVALVGLLFLFSCAPLGSGLQIEGDTLVCDYPKLSMHFKKKIADIQESGPNRIITFMGGDPRPMFIHFERLPKSAKIAAYPSLTSIASSMNHYYLDTVQFGGKEWAKTAFYAGKNCLYCGYFTLKDNEFITIAIRKQFVPRDVAEDFVKYSKTLEMSKKGLDIINEQFDYLNEVVEIRL